MLKNQIGCGLAIIFYLVTATPVKADSINYGDLESDAMYYRDITESSSEDSFPLFGPPSLDGNYLVFDNPTFVADVADDSLDFVDGRMSTTVNAKNGLLVSSFEFSEYGSFLMTGDNTNVFASAVAFVIADGNFYESNFQYSNVNQGSGEWAGSLTFLFPEPVQSFSFVVDNQLFAQAGIGASASIQKNGVRLTVVTVPEPTLVIPGIAFMAMTVGRRRRIPQ